MSRQQTPPISIPSIFHTLSNAPRTREHHQAARQLAGLDPKRFLSNLQQAAVNRSPQAIAALKSDMLELEDIFHNLAWSGHDVSVAQRDFQMLSHFVSQLASTQSQRSSPSSVPSSTSSSYRSSKSPSKQAQQYAEERDYGHHQRTKSLPTSLSSSHEQSRSRSGSSSIDNSAKPSTHYQPHTAQAKVPNKHSLAVQGNGLAQGPTSTSSSSSRSSHSSSIQPLSQQQPNLVAPTPSRLTKPRRHSEPASLPSSASKKVHFASHATVYTFTKEAPALVPPPRPSCIPRVSGSDSPRSASNDERSRY